KLIFSFNATRICPNEYNLSAELVYSGLIKSNRNVLLPPNPLGVTKVAVGENVMLSYPIKLSIKKTFLS
ncbi:hypothetical protein, partial [Legionella feeleii]|uniref:hypothetical protein n=1 Tax=Legionella feeleii TaxID=453 RepID=UPI001B801AF0